jgi:hypothetical protein
MDIDIGIPRRRENFALVAKNQVEFLVQQLALAIQPLFEPLGVNLLFRIFLVNGIRHERDAFLLALAKLSEPFPNDLGHKNLLFYAYIPIYA